MADSQPKTMAKCGYLSGNQIAQKV